MGCVCPTAKEVVTTQFLVSATVEQALDCLSDSNTHAEVAPLMRAAFVHDEKETEYWLADRRSGEEWYIANRRKTKNSYSFSAAVLCKSMRPETAAFTLTVIASVEATAQGTLVTRKMQNFTQYRLFVLPVAKVLPALMANENAAIQRILERQQTYATPGDEGPRPRIQEESPSEASDSSAVDASEAPEGSIPSRV